jgi:hypothetical protein
LLWYFLHQGKEVVYHSAELETTIVITRDPNNNQVLNIADAPARELNMISIPCLIKPETIFIFDAKTQGGEEPPPHTHAFLIETSTRNHKNYAQISRTNVEFYGIPSYSLKELLGICHYFDMTEEEIIKRCVRIGPSIRYILTTTDDDEHFSDVVRNVNETIDMLADPGNIIRYINNSYVNVNHRSACLLLLRVENSSEMEAYQDENLVWEIASKEITFKLMERKTEDARQEFMKKFAETALNVPKWKGVAANFLEVFVPELITTGGYTMLKLEKPQSERRSKRLKSTNSEVTESMRKKKWNVVNQFLAHNVSDALKKCKKVNTLYNFPGIFPGIYCIAQQCRELFQVTVTDRHSILLGTIFEICDFVKEMNPNDTVKLYLVVPNLVYNHYTNWQLFKTEENGQEVERSFVDLPEEVQDRLSNLEQYVICYSFQLVNYYTSSYTCHQTLTIRVVFIIDNISIPGILSINTLDHDKVEKKNETNNIVICPSISTKKILIS